MYSINNRRQTSSSNNNDKNNNKNKSKPAKNNKKSRGDFPKKSKVASSNKDRQTPGVPHPQTGQVIGPYKMRCACGGITGVAKTPWGNDKIQSHINSQQHKDWMKSSSEN